MNSVVRGGRPGRALPLEKVRYAPHVAPLCVLPDYVG